MVISILSSLFRNLFEILTKKIADSSDVKLPILFPSIESIDTFVNINVFDTFAILSPIATDSYQCYLNEKKSKRKVKVEIKLNLELLSINSKWPA